MGDLLAGSDSENEIKFTINKSYSSSYAEWRGKEVLQKLKDRVRRGPQDELSSSDDEDARDLPKLEKSYFKVLSLLKKKDPRIYNEKHTFYPDLNSTSVKDDIEGENKIHGKNRKDKPFVLRDYERKLIIERDGILSDEEEEIHEDPRASSPTYVEEQKEIKNSFKQALENSDEEDEKGFGNLLKRRAKTESEKREEETDYREWLKGRKSELNDKDTESDLKVLHDYWTDPNLNSDDVYLRDYILNKRFLEPEDEEFTPAFNEIVHDSDRLENDLKYVNEQEEFEKKYNFRFEEPDPEFIKRYPRSVETSLRRKDDRRKIKRQEIRERKEAEIAAKREDIKQLKALKKKEILAKIEKIKEITGNDDIDFKDEDLEDDFNPEKHDQKMRELFSDNYYEVTEAEKPECPELEEDLEIENWENWKGKDDEDGQYNGYDGEETWEQPQCENPNFNMDCDYDPRAQLQEELTRITKSKKKQRRRSKFAQVVAKEKPAFDPNSKKFEEYFEEYYKLDCEDIIGDLPCRFKYRRTIPNDYGLTVDEILRADVKELNKWCSLKKVVKYKPENVEKYEVQAYRKKATNEALKRKLLPSLYVSGPDDQAFGNINEEVKNKNKKKKNKKHTDIEQDSNMEFESVQNHEFDPAITHIMADVKDVKIKKEKDKYNKQYNSINNSECLQAENPSQFEMTRIEENDNVNKKMMKKRKYKHGDDKIQPNSSKKQKLDDTSCSITDSMQKKTKKEKRKDVRSDVLTDQKQEKQEQREMPNNQGKRNKLHNDMKKKKKSVSRSDANVPISDTRLKAYGIHPKKFKNKIRYGNKPNLWW